jgi:ubiquinone/menaquinone biosynthesis C-methylase UbiE
VQVALKIAQQLRKPQGLLGRILGKLMRFGNKPANVWAISLADVRPSDRVLEVGFGSGVAIRQLARLAPEGQVCGVDFSPEMVRQARKLNAASVAAGRVNLREGEATTLPFGDDTFDKVLSVNVIYFWPEPLRSLNEIRRVLKPGGRLVLYFTHRDSMSGFPVTRTPVFALYTGEEVVGLLDKAGFSRSWSCQKGFPGRLGICALAEK